MDNGLKKAIEACPAFEDEGGKRREKGTQSALAGHLGITRGAIAQWKRVPTDRVVDVERITGVDRSALRPDLYSRENVA